jgi:cobalt/nickel transport system permease protein
MIAAVVGLQLGAFGVVVETASSGISALPFATFLAIMQPIHLAIGIIEGVVTASVISFVYTAKPEILQSVMEVRPIGAHPVRNVALGFLAAAVITGGILSWFASEHPDGLEWSITKVTGQEELTGEEKGLHIKLSSLQKSLAFLPGYAFKNAEDAKPTEKTAEKKAGQEYKKEGIKPVADKLATSISGIVGGTITLSLCFLIGFILKRKTLPSRSHSF